MRFARWSPARSGSRYSRHGAAYAKGEQAISLPRRGGRFDAEFIDLARVVRGEKSLAWNASHDLAVHETVLRASGVWDV